MKKCILALALAVPWLCGAQSNFPTGDQCDGAAGRVVFAAHFITATWYAKDGSVHQFACSPNTASRPADPFGVDPTDTYFYAECEEQNGAGFRLLYSNEFVGYRQPHAFVNVSKTSAGVDGMPQAGALTCEFNY